MSCFSPSQLAGLIGGVLVGSSLLTALVIIVVIFKLRKSHFSYSETKNAENGTSPTYNGPPPHAKGFTNVVFRDDAGKNVFVDIPLNSYDNLTKCPSFEEASNAKGVYIRNENNKKSNNAVTKLKRFSKPSISFSSSKKLWGSEDKPKVQPKSFSVPLKSQDFTGLGFNIYGDITSGIYIKEILSRGPAKESGKIKPGDRILNLTISFSKIVFEDALTILSYASPYEITLELMREKLENGLDFESEETDQNFEAQQSELGTKRLGDNDDQGSTENIDLDNNSDTTNKPPFNIPSLFDYYEHPTSIKNLEGDHIETEAHQNTSAKWVGDFADPDQATDSLNSELKPATYSYSKLKNWLYHSNSNKPITSSPRQMVAGESEIVKASQEYGTSEQIKIPLSSSNGKVSIEKEPSSDTSKEEDIDAVIKNYEKSTKFRTTSTSIAKHLALYKQKIKKELADIKEKRLSHQDKLVEDIIAQPSENPNKPDNTHKPGSQIRRLSRSVENIYHKYIEKIDHRDSNESLDKIKRSHSLMQHKPFGVESKLAKGRRTSHGVVSKNKIIEGDCVNLKIGEVIANKFSKCQPRKSLNTTTISNPMLTKPQITFPNDDESANDVNEEENNHFGKSSIPVAGKNQYRVKFKDVSSEDLDDNINESPEEEEVKDDRDVRDTMAHFKSLIQRFGETSSDESETNEVRGSKNKYEDQLQYKAQNIALVSAAGSEKLKFGEPDINENMRTTSSAANVNPSAASNIVIKESNKKEHTLDDINNDNDALGKPNFNNVYNEGKESTDENIGSEPIPLTQGPTIETMPTIREESVNPYMNKDQKVDFTEQTIRNKESNKLVSQTSNSSTEKKSQGLDFKNETKDTTSDVSEEKENLPVSLSELQRSEKRKRDRSNKNHMKPQKNKIVGTAHRIIADVSSSSTMQEGEPKEFYGKYNDNNNNSCLLQARLDPMVGNQKDKVNQQIISPKNYDIGDNPISREDIKKANYFCDYTGRIFPAGSDDNNPSFLIISPSGASDDDEEQPESCEYSTAHCMSESLPPTYEGRERYRELRLEPSKYTSERDEIGYNVPNRDQKGPESGKKSSKKHKFLTKYNLIKPSRKDFASFDKEKKPFYDNKLNYKDNYFYNSYGNDALNQIIDDELKDKEFNLHYQIIHDAKHDCRIADIKPIQYPTASMGTPWISHNIPSDIRQQYSPIYTDVSYVDYSSWSNRNSYNQGLRPSIYPSSNNNNYLENPNENYNYYKPHYTNGTSNIRRYNSHAAPAKHSTGINKDRIPSFKATLRNSCNRKIDRRSENKRGISTPIYGIPRLLERNQFINYVRNPTISRRPDFIDD